MRIIFIGQRGIPMWAQSKECATERRVEVLAQELAKAGHEVAAICARPFISKHITHYNGVKLVHTFSLNPEKPGGIIHLLLALVTLSYNQPDVVHFHGWKAAVLSRLAALLLPDATFVWTIDHVPTQHVRLARLIAWQAQSVFDAAVAPTRQLQYDLLNMYGLRTHYIPDGYMEPTLPDVPLGRFGLRKEQYCLTTAMELHDIRNIARAYALAGSRKKLVVVQDMTPQLTALARRFPFLQVAGVQRGRTLNSLIGNAAVVIAAGDATATSTLLEAMDRKRAIVATVHPLMEEILGTTAQFVDEKDREGLTDALKSLLSKKQKRVYWGAKARQRAKNHFRWQRVLPEYLALYHYPLVRRVPVDSAVQSPLAKLFV